MVVEFGSFFLYEPFSHGVKERIREEQDHRCAKCGKKTKQLQIHHEIAQVVNGTDDRSNGIGLCPIDHQEADYNILELGLTYGGKYLNEMPDERFKGGINPFKHIDLSEIPPSERHNLMMAIVGRDSKEKHLEKQKKKKKKKGKWKLK